MYTCGAGSVYRYRPTIFARPVTTTYMHLDIETSSPSIRHATLRQDPMTCETTRPGKRIYSPSRFVMNHISKSDVLF